MKLISNIVHKKLQINYKFACSYVFAVMGEGEHEVQGQKMMKQDKANQDDDDSGYIHMASLSLHIQH